MTLVVTELCTILYCCANTAGRCLSYFLNDHWFSWSCGIYNRLEFLHWKVFAIMPENFKIHHYNHYISIEIFCICEHLQKFPMQTNSSLNYSTQTRVTPHEYELRVVDNFTASTDWTCHLTLHTVC